MAFGSTGVYASRCLALLYAHPEAHRSCPSPSCHNPSCFLPSRAHLPGLDRASHYPLLNVKPPVHQSTAYQSTTHLRSLPLYTHLSSMLDLLSIIKTSLTTSTTSSSSSPMHSKHQSQPSPSHDDFLHVGSPKVFSANWNSG